MSQPVKLSDGLVLDARLAGEIVERSIAGQVEFWASLGRSVELLLQGRQVMSLRRNAEAQPLSEALASVDTAAGRQRVAEVLAARPFPHFEQAPGHPGLLVRTDADGTETIGRFVNRVFEAVPAKKRLRTANKAKRAASAKAVSHPTPVKEESARARAKRPAVPVEREAWA